MRKAGFRCPVDVNTLGSQMIQLMQVVYQGELPQGRIGPMNMQEQSPGHSSIRVGLRRHNGVQIQASIGTGQHIS